jgi:hypothetical protein
MGYHARCQIPGLLRQLKLDDFAGTLVCRHLAEIIYLKGSLEDRVFRQPVPQSQSHLHTS